MLSPPFQVWSTPRREAQGGGRSQTEPNASRSSGFATNFPPHLGSLFLGRQISDGNLIGQIFGVRKSLLRFMTRGGSRH